MIDAPFVQIELTTVCNLKCFYCAGRSMPQRHMDRALFDAILNRLPKQRLRVSLQGEGEPFMHPQIWEFIEAVMARGHEPYTITNGTIVRYPERVASSFPQIGISIDTLDEEVARKVGRGEVKLALRGLDRLLKHMRPRRIIVHTVNFGQPMHELRDYVRALGCQHQIQPLQQKEDYSRVYPDRASKISNNGTHCHLVATRRMRYFNIEGIEMPCAFIKDAGQYRGIEWIRECFRADQVPNCCTGCRMLVPKPKSARAGTLRSTAERAN
ncbi:MAG TPA: radical SAM protein [Steroidobacteraceae bacterium]|nr:radical SAM protein [Steroidobacteraceae bacterium]